MAPVGGLCSRCIQNRERIFMSLLVSLPRLQSDPVVQIASTVFRAVSSPFPESPFRFADTNATGPAWLPRPALLSSRCSYDGKLWVARDESALRSRLHKGKGHAPVSPRQISFHFPALSKPAKCGGGWGQQWLEAHDRAMHRRSWWTTDTLKIDDCQCRMQAHDPAGDAHSEEL